MIMKAKSVSNIDVSTMFYSDLLVSSIYLNTYFFKLKFLNMFSTNMNLFYFLSRSFNFSIQNYWDKHFSTFEYKSYKKMSEYRGVQLNFFMVFFSATVHSKRTISKLI